MQRNKKRCPKCEKQISSSNFNRHVESCKGANKTPELTELKRLDNGNFQCPYCDDNFSKMGIRYHIWKQHTEEGNVFNPYKEGREAWNKGLTKESDERVAKFGETYKNKLSTGELQHAWLGKHHSDETKAKLKKTGGYRKGSGRGKSGWYKGYWCDSSYELAFVIYNLEHNIDFVRNKLSFEYEFNAKKYKYYPDFIIDDVYIEIKGFETEKDKAKYKNFPFKHKLLKAGDLKHIFQYVEEKYGKDFIKLYEIREGN